MNIIGKIIGLIALVLIIMIIVNVQSVVPYINQIMLGGNSATTSVTAISDDLIRQIKAIYPSESLFSYAGGNRETIQVYAILRSLTVSNSYSYDSHNTKSGLITCTQNGNRLSMVTENIVIPDEMKYVYHFWLTDSERISSSTKHIDFGSVRYTGRQMYIYNLGTSSKEFSFKTYRYIKIINPTTFDIFTESVLQ
jgi:hypothetical protein